MRIAIVAGGFTALGIYNFGRIARLYPDGTLDRSFGSAGFASGADDSITSLVVQADGSIVIGGFFRHIGSIGRTGIARLRPDGSLDTNFASGGTRYVLAVASQEDGKVLIGGTFTNVQLIARTRVARLNLDGHPDTSFDPGTGPNGIVNALAVGRNGKVVLGGAFSSINGITRRRIAQLNGDGSVDSSFDPGLGPSFTVWSLAVQKDGKILLGGVYDSVDGIPRNRIARLNVDGSLDTAFDPGLGANDAVLAIAADKSGKVFIGGSFTQYNGLQRDRVARLDGDIVIFDPLHMGGSFSACLFTFPDQIYTLEYSDFDSETNWIPLPSVSGDGTVKTFKDSQAGSGLRIYRIRTE